MRHGGGNTHLEPKPEPENNYDPETGLYHYRMIGGFCWTKRCLGINVKTKKQCGFVSLKSSRTQKCVRHGGNSGHKKNPTLAKSLTKTGEFTRKKIADKVQTNLDLRLMAEVLALTGGIEKAKIKGQKPKNYVPITNLEEANKFLLDKMKRDQAKE